MTPAPREVRMGAAGMASPRPGGEGGGVARQLFSELPRRYDRLAEWLSMGQNGRWRRTMVERLVGGLAGGRQSPLVLDVATGTAGVALALADRAGATVVGVDLSLEMLGRGAANVADAGLGGAVVLAGARAEQLPFADATFDGLTFTYLLRYVEDVPGTLRELARVVRPGAPVATLDFASPERPFWRAWWWGYTRMVLPVAGFVTGGLPWWRVGRFLGPSISGFTRRHPLPLLVDAWRAAGFVDVGARAMSLGGGLVMWGRRADG